MAKVACYAAVSFQLDTCTPRLFTSLELQTRVITPWLRTIKLSAGYVLIALRSQQSYSSDWSYKPKEGSTDINIFHELPPEISGRGPSEAKLCSPKFDRS